MKRIRTLFLLLTIIGPLHMTEQMFTNIDEFYAIRAAIGQYHALFDPSRADVASVLLITIVWTFVSVLFCALLWENRARLVVMGLFGVFAVAEVHHVIQTIARGAYDAGVITAVPYAIAGFFLVKAVVRELRALGPLPVHLRYGRAV